MLFLSYAAEDGEAARKIVDWFRREQMDVYFWEDPSQRGGRFLNDIERAMSKADAFLALLSPHFLRSPYCHRERELAFHREIDLQASDENVKFIRVLKIADAPYSDTGFLRTYDWLDLTNPAAIDRTLRNLANSLYSNHPRPLGSGKTLSVYVAPSFRNRDDELDRVLRGITNTAGPHFWLITTPPQLGKTWFMDHLAGKVLEETTTWVARRVDIREYPDEMRGNVASLLAQLFGLNLPSNVDFRTLRRIASEILQRGMPHLCLLDSAELLEEENARNLRSHLSEIYRLVQQGGNNNVRLAFIVASRRDDEWRGVTPEPRLSPLPLTEFKVDVVQDALQALAHQMGRTFGTVELRRNAALVYRLTEGLPALLVLCLRWIQREQWVAMDQLESQEIFEALAEEYIRQQLLAHDSLFPGSQKRDSASLNALEHAFRVLVPYRLFTQSHLRHHLESDRRLAALVEGMDWSMHRLWETISGTALLSRPLDEPWQEMQAAIRRLLFRHFYTSDEERAVAHTRARRFAEIWSDGQTGNEQVIGLVECLWHEAAALRFGHASDMEEVLCQSARTLAASLRPSSLYTEAELRRSAARRMRNNEEFQDTVANIPGLFTKLVHIVETIEEP